MRFLRVVTIAVLLAAIILLYPAFLERWNLREMGVRLP